jgi:hypothetical protein
MRVFLDDYLDGNKDIPDATFADLATLLVETLDMFYEILGESAFRPEKALNAAVLMQ